MLRGGTHTVLPLRLDFRVFAANGEESKYKIEVENVSSVSGASLEQHEHGDWTSSSCTCHAVPIKDARYNTKIAVTSAATTSNRPA